MSVRTGPTPERLALAERVKLRRNDGDRLGEIAEALGISESYVSELLHDPDGSKTRARKDGYGGTCADCGGRTTGSNGPKNAPPLCSACANSRRHENRIWTPTLIVAAIREFNQIVGRPPLSTEWLYAAERELLPEPRTFEIWPWASVVLREFGKWSTAIEAAGFKPNRVGGKVRPISPQGTRRQGVNVTRTYIVFRKGDDGLREIGRATTGMGPAAAIQSVVVERGEELGDDDYHAVSVHILGDPFRIVQKPTFARAT